MIPTPSDLPTDPRTYGAGAGDDVLVTIRGRVTRIGAMSVRITVDCIGETGPLSIFLPAEGITAITLTDPEETR